MNICIYDYLFPKCKSNETRVIITECSMEDRAGIMFV